jgi:hypothetical protein
MASNRCIARAQDKVGWHPFSGTGRFGFAEVYGKLGVIDLHRLRRKRSPVHALS